MAGLKRLCLLAPLLMLAACSLPGLPVKGAAADRLTVFAAASLTDPFQDMAAQFEAATPGVDVVFNFAGSQQLVQQLAQGAAVDMLASANDRQMGAAIEARRVISGTQHVFAGNKLVVITPADNPAGLAALQDLAKPGIKVVLAASNVPVGDYTLAFLEKAAAAPEFAAGYDQAVLANVVSYEENVKAVLNKVLLGEADAGVVYTSDVPPGLLDKVHRIEIPAAANVLATYPIAIVADAPNPALAQRFLDFVLSPEGQVVLARHGLIPVKDMD